MKLSTTQQQAVARMRQTGQPLVRRPGGFWTTKGTPESKDGVPDWYVPAQTVMSLTRKGVLRRLEPGPEWGADRVLVETPPEGDHRLKPDSYRTYLRVLLASLIAEVPDCPERVPDKLSSAYNDVLYLETAAERLLTARPDPDADIVSVERDIPPYRNCTFSPFNVWREIIGQRRDRGGQS